MTRTFYTYILTNSKNTVLYIGVTNNLSRRLGEHQLAKTKGFTQKYNVKKLIYYETYTSVVEAIAREKQLKNWHREWKWNLIKQINPELNDLKYDIA